MSRRAADELEISRAALDRAHRPVIVPASSIEQTTFRGGIVSEASAGPAIHDGRLVVSIENVGMGPALNLRGDVLVTLGQGQVPWGIGSVRSPVEGVAAQRANALVFEPDEGQFSPLHSCVIRLSYEDVGDRTYWTALDYDSQTKGYECRVGEGPLPPELALRRPRLILGSE